jgi:hypothetical protein
MLAIEIGNLNPAPLLAQNPHHLVFRDRNLLIALSLTGIGLYPILEESSGLRSNHDPFNRLLD